MPFEPAPKITTNPWTEKQPKEARALRDLASYLRHVPEKEWDYSFVGGKLGCGTLGCALGHAPAVPSCQALGLCWQGDGYTAIKGRGADDPEAAFDLPSGIAIHIFYGLTSYGVAASQVTPGMVADRIDHWLATGSIR